MSTQMILSTVRHANLRTGENSAHASGERPVMIVAVALCGVQVALVAALLVQRSRRRQAEHALRRSDAALRASDREARTLAGRLILSQESERWRTRASLHDNLSEKLALLCIDVERPSRSSARRSAQGSVRSCASSPRQMSASAPTTRAAAARRPAPSIGSRSAICRSAQAGGGRTSGPTGPF